MNKSQLVEHVAGRLHTSKAGAARAVDTVLEAIQKGLLAEGSVTLTGFGTFEVKVRKARVGRNPQTGLPINIEAGRRVGFRVGKGLRDAI